MQRGGKYQKARQRHSAHAISVLRRRLVILSATLVVTSCGDGVGPDAVRSVEVAASSTVLRVGETLLLTVTVRNANGDAVASGTVNWTTSAAGIATVAANGLVSGHTAGPVTITAVVRGVTGSLELTVVTTGAAVVSMPAFSFVPFTTTIAAGETVTFDFPSEPHNVIFARIAGAPADILATSNRSVPRTFSVAGSFAYECTLHPGMSGVVVVQ